VSVDATRWAWEQRVRGTDKLVLLSLADRADENFLAFPSAQRLTKDTGLNGKTVFAALQRLLEKGLIEDTGEKVGDTGRVKIYRLMGCNARESNAPKNGGIRNAKKAAAIAKKAAESESTQKRNDTENGIIPNLDSNTPENGSRNTPKNGCQNLKDLTNRNLGDINPQSLEILPEAPQSKSATETPPGFEEFKIPEWLDRELWSAWEKYRATRIAKPWDDLAKAKALGELFKANQQGQDIGEVIANAMRRHWEFPYPLKGAAVGKDIPLAEIVDLYNRICAAAGMLPCESMTPDRQGLIARRVRDAGMTLDDWETFFRHAAKKPNLTGKGKAREGFTSPFRAQIDHLLNNKGFTQIDEELRAGVSP
jgi:DNA-binding PadR family transcriptional regulator